MVYDGFEKGLIEYGLSLEDMTVGNVVVVMQTRLLKVTLTTS